MQTLKNPRGGGQGAEPRALIGYEKKNDTVTAQMVLSLCDCVRRTVCCPEPVVHNVCVGGGEGEVILLIRGHLVISRDTFGCHH